MKVVPKTLHAHFLSPWSQLAMTAAVLLLGYATMWWFNDGVVDTPFVEVRELHAYLFGLGTMLALIGPIIFGFSAQELHACVAERDEALRDYHASVDRLIDEMHRLRAEGKLSTDKYLDILREVYALQEGEIDNFYPEGVWERAAKSLRKWFRSETKGSGNERLFMATVMPLMLRVEQRINRININVIRRLIAQNTANRSVRSAFASIAVLMAVLVFSSFEYQALANLYFLITMGVTIFSAFLVLELILVARMGAREVISDGSDLELDEDIDDEH